MNELTIEWQEAGQLKRETIHDQQRSKYPGTVRLGRDPVRCDVVLSEPTVSGLHIEIFFHVQQQSFALRNLRATNPPLVDGKIIVQGEAFLKTGSTIYLGQLRLTVAVSLAVPTKGIAPTVLMPPQALVVAQPPAPAAVSYGLQCPSCYRISSYERLDWGCQWCGTSLAAAVSVLMTRNGS